MRASSRAIVNTGAQYIKTFINILLTLYSARLILSALGVSDYGIYSLIAGVVSMLSFVTTSLASTTQRFISYNQGLGDKLVVRIVFGNSLYIHIFLGIAISGLLLTLTPVLFNGFLNIPVDRLSIARDVYRAVVTMVFLSFITTPFRAVLVSNENIVFLSVIDVIDGILKVIVAVLLTRVSIDRLFAYGIFLLFIQLFNLLAIATYSLFKYEECKLQPISCVRRKVVVEMLSFAGWQIYSIGCVVGRTQGIAIVINKFFSAVVNAAYGLGFQIAGYVNFMSESVLSALKPQIIKAEGGGNRFRMLWLSQLASKFCFFLLSCVAVPCIFEMPSLLDIWLDEVPVHAVLFCRMVMIAGVVDTLTIGLGVANQAVGNIKQYSLVVNSTKLLTLPVVWLCLKNGLPIISVSICYVIFEFTCAMIRLPFLRKTAGLNLRLFVKNVFAQELLPFIALIGVNLLIVHVFTFHFRFLMTFPISVITYCVVIYFYGLDKNEKEILTSFVQKIRKQ